MTSRAYHGSLRSLAQKPRRRSCMRTSEPTLNKELYMPPDSALAAETDSMQSWQSSAYTIHEGEEPSATNAEPPLAANRIRQNHTESVNGASPHASAKSVSIAPTESYQASSSTLSRTPPPHPAKQPAKHPTLNDNVSDVHSVSISSRRRSEIEHGPILQPLNSIPANLQQQNSETTEPTVPLTAAHNEIAPTKQSPHLFVRNAPVRESVRSYATSATFPEDERAQRDMDEQLMDEELGWMPKTDDPAVTPPPLPPSSSLAPLSATASVPLFQSEFSGESQGETKGDELSIHLDSDLESTESESEYHEWKQKQANQVAARRVLDRDNDFRKRFQNLESFVVNMDAHSQDGSEMEEVMLENELMGRRGSSPNTLDDPNHDSGPKTVEEQEIEATFGTLKSEVKVSGEKQLRLRDSSYYFNDGKRVIDFVLAFQPKLELKDRGILRKEVLHRRYRKAFEDKLEDLGLELEHEGIDKSQDGKTCFTKVHATWEFLCRQAELQQIKVPLAPLDLDAKPNKTGLHEKTLQRCCDGTNPFRLPDFVLPDIDLSYKARFDSARTSMFLIENEDTFFTPTQRIRMVYDTIQRTTVKPMQLKKSQKLKLRIKDDDKEATALVSFFSLMQKKVYTAAYPLHDSEFKYPDNDHPFWNVDPKLLPERYWLYKYWGDFKMWKMFQPLDQVADYFGVRVGLYFAWLGFYTRWLYLPSLVGLLCFIYGIVSMMYDGVVKQFCDKNAWGNQTTCRLCPDENCPYGKLYTNCAYAQISHVFDNYSTVVFTIFLSIWSIAFLEEWKRRQAEFTARWDSADLEFNDVVLRAKFQLDVTERHVNPVTQVEEPYVSKETKMRHLIASLVAVIFFVLVVLAFMVALIMYRILSVAVYSRLHNWFIELVSPNMVTSVTTSVANAVVIFVMTLLYRRAAWWLTEYEYPRTDDEFEVSYTYKVFMFQFMNYYGSLFYLALLKGKFEDSLNDLDPFSDQCGYSGCMAEVCIQLIIIMSGKQILNNVVEAGMPILHNYFRMRSVKQETEDNEFSRWERDYVLNAVPQPGQFSDYLEMIIQYGFLVMFAPAFPLAALFALLNNILEIRIDANKLLTEYRRPLPERVPNIGPWFPILELLTKMAVIVNALVISFTSDFIDRAVYQVFYKHAAIEGGAAYMNFTFTTFDPRQYITLTYPNIAWGTALATGPQNNTITECFYKGYYGRAGAPDEYERTITWWHMITARLAFVLIFEHFVFFVQSIIQNCIPDMPEHVELKIERERFVTKQLYMKQALGDEKYKKVFDKEEESEKSASYKAPAVQPDLPKQSLPKSASSHMFSKMLGGFRRSTLPVIQTGPSSPPSLSDATASVDVSDQKMGNGTGVPTRRKPASRPWFMTLFRKANLFC